MKRLSALLLLLALLFVGCEAKKANEPKTEGTEEKAKADEPKTDEAKADEPKTDEAKADEPKTDEAKADEPKTDEAKAEEAGEASDALAAGVTQHYGAAFELADEPMALADAVAKLDELLEKKVKVASKVKTSCRKKGCWMQLEPLAEGQEPVRVTFKDYGFFVPKHADGASAIMEGSFVRETLSENQRKHHAEEAKAPQEEIDAIKGDVETLKFEATGVELTGA